jgi:hypothetical protein
MVPRVRLNPCELEIDLQCKGLQVDDSCDLGRDARGLRRTRAGLGSGLELVIAGAPPVGRDVWTNAPVTEAFAAFSPYALHRTDEGGYEIRDARSAESYPVRLPPEPAWYGARTSTGLEMAQVGVLQGTYLGIYLGTTCALWREDPRLNCRFCTTGVNPIAAKSVADVVETARAAKAESGITFVHLNTGYQRGAALRLVAPYVEAIKREVGALVGVQVFPEAPLEEFDRLRALGVDHFSFCFEYYDPETFRQICPGKHQTVGQGAFFRALEHCQRHMPKGSCSGEIVAGNEPLASTLAAIDYITSVGAFPTVCIFRPLAGSDMEKEPPPRYEDMRRVMQHQWQRCRDRGIPIGLAPGIEVSLVVQPTDTAYLAEGTWRDRWYRAKLAVARRLAAPLFRRRMRTAG